jgi:hypothetical protein
MAGVNFRDDTIRLSETPGVGYSLVHDPRHRPMPGTRQTQLTWTDMPQPTEPPKTGPQTGIADVQAPTDAHFNETQMRMLRAAVIGMGILLVVGVLVLIGRIVYLARSGGTLTSGTTVAVPTSQLKFAPDVKVALPSGAMVKSTTVSDDRLTIAYADARGDGILIVDLTTGQVISRVRIERAP